MSINQKIIKKLNLEQYSTEKIQKLLGGGCGQSNPAYGPKEQKILQENFQSKTVNLLNNDQQNQDDLTITQKIYDILDGESGLSKESYFQQLLEIQQILKTLVKIKNLKTLLYQTQNQIIDIIQKFISLYLAFQQELIHEDNEKDVIDHQQMIKIVKSLIVKIKGLCQTEPFLHILYYFDLLKKIIILQKNKQDSILLQSYIPNFQKGLFGIVFFEDSEQLLKIMAQTQSDLIPLNQKNILTSIFGFKEEILLSLIKQRRKDQTMQQQPHLILDTHIFCYHKVFQSKIIVESSDELVCYALQQIHALIEMIKNLVFDNGKKYQIDQSKHLIPFLEDSKYGILKFTKTCSFAEKIGVDVRSYLNYSKIIRYFSTKILLLLVELFEEQKKTSLLIYDKICDQLYILLFLEKSPFINALLYSNPSAKKIFQEKSKESQVNLSNEIISLNQRQQEIKQLANQELQKSQKRKVSQMTIQQLNQIESYKNLKQENFTLFLQNKLIESWRESIKRKREKGLVEKDDHLIETVEYYIEQEFKLFNLEEINDFDTITVNEVKGNNDIFMFIKNKISSQQQNVSQNFEKMFIVVGEEGLGKSILLKKIEFSFIQSEQNSTNLTIPIMLSFENLQNKSYSLEKTIEDCAYFLSSTNLSVDSLKECDYQKIILIDGFKDPDGFFSNIWQDLNLGSWKNTKIVIACRDSDYHSIYNKNQLFKISQDNIEIQIENNQQRQQEYFVLFLQQFNETQILKYFQKYFYLNYDVKQSFKLYQTAEQLFKKQREIYQLIQVPINLYFYTRMIGQECSQKENSQIEKLSQIQNSFQLQEKFIYLTFERQILFGHQALFQKLGIIQNNIEKEKLLSLMIEQYFYYFENASLYLFNKKRNEREDLLQNYSFHEIPIDLIEDLKEFIIKKIKENSKSQKEQNENENERKFRVEEYELCSMIKKYFETSSLLEIKQQSIKKLWCSDYEQVFTFDFKHTQILEHFVARAMIRDFKNQSNLSIRNLPLITLNNFAINSIYIVTPHSQFEKDQLGFGILNQLCKLISEEIIKEEQLHQSIHKDQNYEQLDMPKNNKFIEYIQRTRDRDIMKMKLKHQLDVGSSNLLSVLCQLKYNLSGIDFSFCSFSCAYLFDYKGKQINFTGSNLNNANISDSLINSTLARTENCISWGDQILFDSHNLFSFNKINYFHDDSNFVVCGTDTGYLNIYCFDKNKRMLQMNSSNNRSRNNSQDAKYSSQQSLVNSPNQRKVKTDISSRSKSRSPQQRPVNSQKSLNNSNIRPGTSQSVNSSMEQVQYQINVSQVQINNSLLNSTCNFSQLSLNDDYQTQQSYLQDSQLLKSKIYFKGAINDLEDYFNTVIVSQNSNVLCIHKYTLDLLSMLQAHDQGEIRMSLCKRKHMFATISLIESTCKIWQINKQKGFVLVQRLEEKFESFKYFTSAVRLSSDGKILALGSTDSYVRIYNQSQSNSFALVQKIKIHCKSPISHLVFSSNSQYLAVGGKQEEKYLTILEQTSQNSFYPIKISQEKENRFLQIVQFTPSCRNMVTSYQKSGKLILWLISNNSKISQVDCVQVVQDGSCISSISFFYQQNITIDSTLEDAGNVLMCIGSNQSQNLITYSIRDNKFILKEQKIRGHEKSIHTITISKNSIVSYSKDQICINWNINQSTSQLDQMQVIPYMIMEDIAQQEIQQLSFSPDNKLFAVVLSKKGKVDSFCQIFLVDDGKNISGINKESLFLLIQSKNIKCVCFSPDTQLLALADSEINSISIFRLETKEKIFEIRLDNQQSNNTNINFMQFSKNNKYLYAIDDSKVCYLWDVSQQYHEVASIKLGKSNNKIIGTSLAPDNNIFRIVTSKGELRSFNIFNNLEVLQKQYFNQEDSFSPAENSNNQYIISTFSHDSNFVAIASQKHVEIWRLEQNQLLLIDFIQDEIVSPIHISYLQNTHDQICLVDQEKRIRIFDFSQVVKRQKFNPQYIGHVSEIVSIEYSLGSSAFLLTTSRDYVSKLWNTNKGYQLIQTFYNTRQIHMNQSEDTLVIVPLDPYKNEIIFLDVSQNFTVLHNLQIDKKINQVRFSPNLQLITTCFQDSIKLWNYSKKEIVCFQELNCIDFAEIIKFSTDSVYLAASFGNGQLSIWKKERNQYQLITNLTCVTEDKKFTHINSFAFSNNKKFLTVAFSNKKIIVWGIDKLTFQIKFEETLAYGSPLNVLFSSNNTQLVSQNEDYSVKVWDIKNDSFSKVENVKLSSHAPYNINNNSISATMDFKHLAIGYQNSSLEIWNIEKGIVNSLKQRNSCLQYII